jgi:ribosomal protein S18 acetylase RimI-like enzyme
VGRTPESLPSPDSVRQFYALVSARKPFSVPAESADVYAVLHPASVRRHDLAVVTVSEGDELVGFGYSQPWRWAEQTDEWSLRLAEGLGDAASSLEESAAVQLLAVHPSFTRNGLGFELLRHLMVVAVSSTYWLQIADVDAAARRLLRGMGYRPVGRAPAEPGSKPGLVLLHG